MRTFVLTAMILFWFFHVCVVFYQFVFPLHAMKNKRHFKWIHLVLVCIGKPYTVHFRILYKYITNYTVNAHYYVRLLLNASSELIPVQRELLWKVPVPGPCSITNNQSRMALPKSIPRVVSIVSLWFDCYATEEGPQTEVLLQDFPSYYNKFINSVKCVIMLIVTSFSRGNSLFRGDCSCCKSDSGGLVQITET